MEGFAYVELNPSLKMDVEVFFFKKKKNKRKNSTPHSDKSSTVLHFLFLFFVNGFYVQLNKIQLDSPIFFCIQLILVWYFGSMKKNLAPRKYAV